MVSVNSGDERMRTLDFKGLPIPEWLIKTIMRLMIGIRKPRKTLGITLAGVVEKAGGAVSDFTVGDEIYAMTGSRFGAFAEYAVLKADHCVALKPKKADFVQAAAIPFGGTTAMYFLRKAELDTAKTVLIYGSTGAVGVAAVQIAVHAGAEVTAVSGPSGVELSKKLGATTVIDYTKHNLADQKATFDIVFDAVGHLSKQEAAQIMSDHGRYVSVVSLDSAQEQASDLEFLAKLYDDGDFVEVIDSVYDFNDMQKAFKRVGTGHKKGSVVVKVQHWRN